MTDLSVRLLDRSAEFGGVAASSPIAAETFDCLNLISNDYQVPLDFDAIIPASNFATMEQYLNSKDKTADTIYSHARRAMEVLSLADEQSVETSLELLIGPLAFFVNVIAPEAADGII